MAKKKVEPKLLSGSMYFLDEYLSSDELELFAEGLIAVEEERLELFTLSRGNIFKNEKAVKHRPNEVIIFDFTLKEHWDGSFRGFLYPDGTVSGKIKYVESSKLKDETIEGLYEWKTKKKISIVGNCIEVTGVKYGVHIVLRK